MFPDSLYRFLTASDEQGSPLVPSPFYRSVSATPANMVIQTPPVPQDRILVVSYVHLWALPTGGENVVDLHLHVRDSLPGNNIRAKLRTVGPFGANARIEVTGPASLFGVFSGWFIEGVINKNAAVNALTAELTVLGFLIPLGNIQRLL